MKINKFKKKRSSRGGIPIVYLINTPELILAATVVRSAPSYGLFSFACGLRPHAKLNPRTTLTPFFLSWRFWSITRGKMGGYENMCFGKGREGGVIRIPLTANSQREGEGELYPSPPPCPRRNSQNEHYRIIV